MQVVLVGAGRLATQLALALRASGHEVLAVYSRTLSSAAALTRQAGGTATDDVSQLPPHADLFVIAVSDAAITSLLPRLVAGRRSETFVHTAGSVPLSVFDSFDLSSYGVFYPMQTFSKERQVDFRRIPIFIEASDEPTLARLHQLAASLSSEVRQLSSSERRYLHLAAVFASNFANHCYALSSQVLQRCGLPLSIMLPLIDETAAKVHDLPPAQAQTGPAVRYDTPVIEAQSRLLEADPLLREVYDLMSHSIHELALAHQSSTQ